VSSNTRDPGQPPPILAYIYSHLERPDEARRALEQ